MLGGEERCQEAHQLQRIRKLVVTDLPALLEVESQLTYSLPGKIDDPLVRTLVLRPGLYFGVLRVIELEITGVQVEAGEPAFEQFRDTLFGFAHAHAFLLPGAV
jgi:hypothetical protein